MERIISIKLYIDLETYSSLDIKKVGGYRYAQDCEILLIAYAINDGPVVVLEDEFRKLNQYVPDEIIAHNSFFDRHVLRAHGRTSYVWGASKWRDTMVKAMSLSLPPSLGELGAALGLPYDQQKNMDGKKLINRFCKPAPRSHKAARYTKETHPEEWERFIEYARQDVETMRTIDKLLPDWNYK